MDIGDPNNLQVISELTGFTAQKLAVRGDYAFVAAKEGGLKIISILDPYTPALLGSRSTSDAWDVVPKDHYLFVADGDKGLKVLDVSQARRPVRVLSMSDTEAYELALEGDLLYVAAGDGGLKIYDVTDPEKPVFSGVYINGGIDHVAVKGDFGFVTNLDGLLEILDLSNRERPSPMSRLQLEDPRQLIADGDYLFVAEGRAGLKIFDVTNPAAPILFDESEGTEVTGLDVVENRIYLADRGGLRILETYLKGESFVIAEADTGLHPFHLSLGEDRVYLSGHGQGVEVVDLRRPSTLSGKALLARGAARDASMSLPWGEHLLVADGSEGMTVFSLEPAAADGEEIPELVVTARAPLPAGGDEEIISLAADGEWAYLISKDRGIYPINLQALTEYGGGDPLALTLEPLFPLPAPRALAVRGNRGWVADREEGLVILDLSVPASPRTLEELPVSGARNIRIRGDRLYLVGSQGITFYDIADAESTVKMGQSFTRFAEDVTVQGGYLYLSEGYRGLSVLDISDPSRPIKVSSCSSLYALSAEVIGDYAFVVDADSLKVVQIFIPEWLVR